MKAPLIVLLCTIALVTAAFVIRNAHRPETAGRVIAKPPLKTGVLPAHIPVAPPPPPVVATAESLGKISEDLRIQSTYRNYRTAVAQNNAKLQEALLPVLLKDRKTALKFAEEDLARSTESRDLEITRRAVETLSR